MQLLLLSNSITPNFGGWLDWADEYLDDFITRNGIKDGVFIPFAGISISEADYTKKLADRLAKFGVSISNINTGNIVENAKSAGSIWVGGGNTWVLLKTLQDKGLLDILRDKIISGTPYCGWSAGSNIAAPTIKTTNDMTIVELSSFKALGVVPFQINPHYLDATTSNHGGETREDRIKEFLVKNPTTKVAGLREGLLFDVNGGLSTIKLKGLTERTCRIFSNDKPFYEVGIGESLECLL